MSSHDVNPAQEFGATDGQVDSDWKTEERYWRDTWQSRPYVSADRGFEYYCPGYRYGFEAARTGPRRDWDEIESELRSGWGRYPERGESAWENIMDAVKDAWRRATNR